MSVRKNGELGFERTLCENCQNAVPNADSSRGCNWSMYFKPVEGWNAVPTIIRQGQYDSFGTKKMKTTHSFHVIDCPEFIHD